MKEGFRRLWSDPCAYVRWTTEGIEIITVWVDDLLLFMMTQGLMTSLKLQLQSMFEVTDLGDPKKIVGIEIMRDRAKGTLFIGQTRYIDSILRAQGLEGANSVKTPADTKVQMFPDQDREEECNQNRYASLIRSLMYAAVATRPDIAFAVNRLASFTSNPDLRHWTAAKRILRYLQGTKDYGIMYKAKKGNTTTQLFTGYVDASFANTENRASVTGYVFLAQGGAIVWGSKKQTLIALSTTEAEYAALARCTRECIWLRKLYAELGYRQKGPTNIMTDSEGARALAYNPQFHARTKHFDISHHYTREKISQKKIEVCHCSDRYQTADILTKALPRDKHERHTKEMGMTPA